MWCLQLATGLTTPQYTLWLSLHSFLVSSWRNSSSPKRSPYTLNGGKESAFGQVSTLLTPCQLLTSRIKQTFLSTNLAYLFTFEQQAVRPHFWLEGYQLDEEISTIPATEGKYSLSTYLPSLFPQHNNLEVRTQGFEPCNVFLPLLFSSLPHRHTPSSRSLYLPTKLLQFLLK